MDIQEVSLLAKKLKENVAKVIIGRGDTIEMVIGSLLSDGHVLLEEVPGSGKTTLAKALAASIEGDFKRIQMTPDLLPADITGINFFNVKKSEFEFVKGPVFSNILIADEINRATPKTQAGLLESMDEKQVTVEGVTYKLQDPFMVIATQNPIDSQGVFPLPEAQLDRFLMKLSMGYPEHKDMVDIMRRHMRIGVLERLTPVTDIKTIVEAKEAVRSVEVHEDMLEYVVNLTEASRNEEKILLGISQRGALGLIRAAQAMAAMDGRTYVMPDDIKKCFIPVCAHRLILKTSERIRRGASISISEEILNSVAVPTENL